MDLHASMTCTPQSSLHAIKPTGLSKSRSHSASNLRSLPQSRVRSDFKK